jgi:hypothetical protein
LERWLAENPPTMGNGWEPYPTSLRIVNWVKWLQTGNPPVPGMVESLAAAGAMAEQKAGMAFAGQPFVCQRQGAGVCRAFV